MEVAYSLVLEERLGGSESSCSSNPSMCSMNSWFGCGRRQGMAARTITTKISNAHGSQLFMLPPGFSVVPKYYRAVNSVFITVMCDANHNSTGTRGQDAR